MRSEGKKKKNMIAYKVRLQVLVFLLMKWRNHQCKKLISQPLRMSCEAHLIGRQPILPFDWLIPQ